MDSLPDIIEVGKDIVRGLWEGIKAMASWIGDKVSGFVGGLVDGVKGVLGIHSPSRVFAGIGQNMALGLGQGFEKQMQSVTAGIQCGGRSGERTCGTERRKPRRQLYDQPHPAKRPADRQLASA